MKVHYTKADAFAEVREIQAAGRTARVLREVINVPGSGNTPPRTVVRFYVESTDSSGRIAR
jgi:hypothetical protein